jgi:hypothetical protein
VLHMHNHRVLSSRSPRRTTKPQGLTPPWAVQISPSDSTLHLSAPQLPHLHLRMMQRGQRLLRTGRDAFLLRSLGSLVIHLLIRVWVMIFMFLSIFSPYLAYLSYIVSFLDSYIGGSLHRGGPVWDSWQGQ